ncbi:uncharacterized protein THITE_2110252 [Thermothielavioides terrestris NRRL 8126]|uniref:Uncharacterized protein n=1 Tax=Thermothielavioides terrestris (strain ATCC 38088 / NRRL 8126) TaxID=578455 RepID=G2QS89_THETT|nr:uncharacterized protein THITE_2110252 [Thermothielavioides terrestris NRRL 8126]AEO64278.1 hypothetical protein THITE_2110252 [Thermothielavioides terrestris NRRL 8126]
MALLPRAALWPVWLEPVQPQRPSFPPSVASLACESSCTLPSRVLPFLAANLKSGLKDELRG